MDIGFLGTGSMGLPMARNLLRAGHTLKVWNRSPEKARILVSEGATLAPSPAQAVTPGGIAVTMLSDDTALEGVTKGPEGFLTSLGQGLHLSMSTVSPDLNRRLAKEQALLGGALVAAPVFGRPDAAAAAKLNIPCSGPEAARARALPLLEVLGQCVRDFGEDPGAANVVKLCGNFLILSATQALAECLSVAQANGLDRGAVMDFYSSTNFACPVYKAYGGRLAAEDYSEGGFKLSLAAKDLRLFAGQKGSGHLKLRALLEELFASASARGWDNEDVTALARLVAKP
ncbi:MAG TPA: NAD(P)-dependent oxidoreductase [bacterium]|jgi:3-hydroxyisobutyrate dehydrogenase-like beta-hydroxyacid dehydrogenase|nr:NAD(P)-dependent oxidoreductase [bacterium]